MKKFAMLIAGMSLIQLPVTHAQWYAGANIGINSVSVDKRLSYPLGGSPPANASYDAAYHGFHGQLFAAKRVPINEKVGFAIEGDIDWFTGNADYTINNFFLTAGAQAKEQLKHGFGLYLLPEYRLNKMVKLFAGPGISTTKFSIRSGQTAGNVGVTGAYNQWLKGWGLKVGMASQVTTQTDVLLTYQFNQYNAVTRTNVEPLSADSLTARYKPNINTVMLGLRYTV